MKREREYHKKKGQKEGVARVEVWLKKCKNGCE